MEKIKQEYDDWDDSQTIEPKVEKIKQEKNLYGQAHNEESDAMNEAESREGMF